MASPLKLTYFNLPARGELTRMVLSYGKIPFQDERIRFRDFPALKPTLPLGQLPILTVDGKVYSQSVAIARYAAKLAGLYPQDPLEALRVDMVLDTLAESWTPLLRIQVRFLEKDPVKRQAMTRQFLEVTAPHTFGGLEKMIGGEFFLDRMTLADLALFDQIEHGLKATFPDFNLEAFPKVCNVYDNVKKHPNIAAYLAKQAADQRARARL